ncbi:IscS subfamily cysteine desulfurase [Metabacillus herbersteinensis]|uniref:IscS subfamily cysteine desulfurase n=1 Tax=Metabacillus herbersteinensis TaxID=283816 RepID=A0ABV6G9E3_9BACI
MIYLDYAATTPISEKALNVYIEVSRKAFGNSNSLHDVGESAKALLEGSRELLASLIGGDARGIYFTSGGSESNVLAIQSLLNGVQPQKKHIISTMIEHSSIHTYLTFLQTKGYEVTFLLPDEKGSIDLESIKLALREDTGLVSIQHASGELGTIQNLQEIGELLLQHGILLHSDCVQSFGKVAIDVKAFNIAALSFSSHKVYGPKGVGAVYLNPSVYWTPTIPGTTHESGFRPGTVNIPGAASFATAAKEIYDNMENEHARIYQLRTYLFEKLSAYQNELTILNNENQLPHIIGMTINGIEGQYTMLECNRYGLAISTGSACQVGMQKPSRSLLALGMKPDQAKQYIRISLGKQTTMDHMDQLSTVLKDLISKN